MEFKLSICMMVKDEEKNLRRCLESLKLLIDKPYTELIIVDTGSKDKTIDIAREYTEKLYFHPWNNNFGDMRNITISYAKGEWIFIMDADEELKNSQELLDLLNDDRINRFNTIMLREKEAQRIVVPGNTINAELFNTSRLFKNDGKFKYIGAVHNQPISKNPTFLAQDIILHHYGYDISDKELMEKKFKRTSELLKGEISKEPENVYYRYQLSVSYSMHGDKKEAWDEIQKAYALIKDKSDKIKKTYSYVYNKYAVFGYAQGKYERIIDVCKEGINVRPDYVDLYFFAAQAFEVIKHDKEAIEYYKKYLELMDDFENSTFATDFSVVLHTAVVESQNYAHEKLAIDYMNNNNYTEAIKHAKLIKVNSNELVSLLFNIYIKFQKYDELKNYYITLEEDKKNYLTYILEERKIILNVQEIENTEHSFSQLKDSYGLLNRIRISIKENRNSLDEDKNIESLDFNNLPDYYGDIIYKLLKIKYPIYDILTSCFELRLNKFFQYIGSKYEDLTETILAYLYENKEENNFNQIRVNRALKRYIIAFDKMNDNEFSQIFKSYISDGTIYISEVYSKRIIEEERIFDLKNDEEAFLIYMYKAEYVKDSNESEYVKYLRKALRSFPEMKKGIEILLNELKEKQNFMNDEMEILRRQLKENIRALIESENMQEAKALINEYRKMVFNDIDIYSMNAVIAIMEGNLLEAESILKNGLKKDCNNFDLNYNLAYLYEQKGLYLKAIETYENIVFNMKDGEQRQQIIEYSNKLEYDHREVIQDELDKINMMEYGICKDTEESFKLHIMYDSQFCDKFIKFVNSNYKQQEHKFIIIYNKDEKLKFMNIENIENVEILDMRYDLKKLLHYIDKCSKVFIHYLFDYFCVLVCKFNIKKSMNWMLWGGDLYNYIDLEMYEPMTKKLLKDFGIDANNNINKNTIEYVCRKATIRRIKYILTDIEGDYNKIRENFITVASRKSFLYPQPVEFEKYKCSDLRGNNLLVNNKYKYTILLGNSASPANNHLDIIYKLSKLIDNNFSVIVPLSYGGYDMYVEKIVNEGKRLLGDRFIPLLKYMEAEEYFKIISKVDFGIFYQNRQQAGGNIIALLYAGKTVFVKKENTLFKYLTNMGLMLYDASSINNKLVEINDNNKIKNSEIIREKLGNCKYKEYMDKIFL
ncbi:TDP-N-acetylfucosamine:lipid II N-acetylfucosaminyltransferase [Clostridiaceae bacterium UIB06]|uniref:TDP-N-acetylfucosamine:lipid II N-acetylfucosaminyltransferase n=1 Tax=Clostridium thailandense TaxID=2794346 RepID=A0A949TKN5_9CLOT|nr:TDP-N-acetylfucosamine:lipid II N-acetylfucosaminyltransferase [Clostridium thailandense]MBV7272252.1 TDP-N-acetylfucosamine:lipid II N-acetylfucosaminyltransferase [Clostridium thailandense]MCH5137798.1 TDP-N-acetylfucosamine:lipid II N-acetylfucosaminyltransferase [Clostridiaceae bacterium UIB06]